MTYPAALSRGRRRTQRIRMDSRCTIWRDTGVTEQDDATDLEGRVHRAAHRDLPLRIKPGRSRTLILGDAEVEQGLGEAHVPASTADIRDGDLIEVTVGESAGVWLRIVEAVLADGRTARRLPVEQVDRPDDLLEETP